MQQNKWQKLCRVAEAAHFSASLSSLAQVG